MKLPSRVSSGCCSLGKGVGLVWICDCGQSPCAEPAQDRGRPHFLSSCLYLSPTLSPSDPRTSQVTERRDLDPGRMQMPQGNPLLLSYTLQELLARDTVQVELIPEKKGLFLKHVEYEVSSQVTGT